MTHTPLDLTFRNLEFIKSYFHLRFCHRKIVLSSCPKPTPPQRKNHSFLTDHDGVAYGSFDRFQADDHGGCRPGMYIIRQNYRIGKRVFCFAVWLLVVVSVHRADADDVGSRIQPEVGHQSPREAAN
eukprot:scaffold37572_cov176-Amphora_coffeaeformis.AAC.4